jgi:predicted DNA-binding antitoxin AbrB/MazE fold protein
MKTQKVEGEKPTVTLPGIVEKIVKPVVESEPEKAQIAVEGADELYKEIRIENVLETPDGDKVKLKQGAAVEVKIAAPLDSIEKKPA